MKTAKRPTYYPGEYGADYQEPQPTAAISRDAIAEYVTEMVNANPSFPWDALDRLEYAGE